MSMSGLSAQLAHINSSSRASSGTTLSASRRHDDAIGRGIHHSAKHGHSVRGISSKNFASVLYANQKQASDVPLTTIRENGYIALHQLSKITGDTRFTTFQYVKQLFSDRSITFERGLATPDMNSKIDQNILSLLTLLSTTFSSLGNESNENFSQQSTSIAALHVLEYLIRRYDVHARENTAHALLVCLWAHHDEFVKIDKSGNSVSLYNRILQLVNVAEISNQSWIFLRPYAVKDSPPPTRSTFAKHCAKNDALIMQCCLLAQSMGKLAVSTKEKNYDSDEHQDQSNDMEIEVYDNGSDYKCSKGIAHVISFTAALLVEALTLQSKEHSTVQESTLRIMLPFILSACGPDGDHDSSTSLLHKCPDYRAWGYILCTTLSRNSVLSSATKEVLVNTILAGITNNKKSSELNVDSLESVTDAIVVLMMIVGQESPSNQFVEKLKENMKKKTGVQMTSDILKSILNYGCELPFSTFQKIVENPFFVPALGSLRKDRGVDISSLLFSLTSMAVVMLDSSRLDSKEQTKNVGLSVIKALTEEPALKSSWRGSKNKQLDASTKGAALAAQITFSIISFFVSRSKKKQKKRQKSDNVDDKELDIFRENCQSALNFIRTVAQTGCDTGTANAVRKIMKKEKSDQTLLTSILSSSTMDGNKSIDKATEGTTETDYLLPPRFALEHSNSDVRLHAIEKLMEENKVKSNRKTIKEDGLIVTLLLRRICQDNDMNVALSASNALNDLMKNKERKCRNPTVEEAVAALKKWNMISATNEESSRKKKKQVTPDTASITVLVLSLCGATVSNIPKSKSINNESVDLLLQGIISHLAIENEQIRMSAASALLLCLSLPAKNEDKEQKAKAALITNQTCQRLLNQSISTENKSMKAFSNTIHDEIRWKYVFVTLNSYKTILDEHEKQKTLVDTHQSLIDSIMTASVSIFLTFSRNENRAYNTIIELSATCVKMCSNILFLSRSLETMAKIQDLIIQIASIGSDAAFKSVGISIIQHLLSFVVNKSCSSIAILMEGALRPDTSNVAISRLLELLTLQVKSKTLSALRLMEGIIPSLSLLHNADRNVREASLDFLAEFSSLVAANSSSSKELVAVAALCHLASEKGVSWSFRSDLVMDGATALPRLLRKAINDSASPTILRKALLQHCYYIATSKVATMESKSKVFEQWLPVGNAKGGCRAASSFLSTIDLMEDAVFPLKERWDFAGKEICESFCSSDYENGRGNIQNTHINSVIAHLLEIVARMLKGIIIDENVAEAANASNVVIMTSPSKEGGRRRSYSVSAIDGANFIDPYPKDMANCVYKFLSESSCNQIYFDFFQRKIIDLVISSSWGNSIFPKLTKKMQKSIAKSLLMIRSKGNDNAGTALMNLPLDYDDFSQLWKHIQSDEEFASESSNNLLALTLLAELIKSKTSTISKGKEAPWKLISLIFNELTSLATIKSGKSYEAPKLEEGAFDFTCLCLLQTLVSLFDSIVLSNGESSGIKTKTLKSHVTLLVTLIESGDGHRLSNGDIIMPLISDKARAAALNLLAHLCDMAPSEVVDSLVPAMMDAIVVSIPDRQVKSADEALSVVVPAFCTHASTTGLKIVHLLSRFMSSCSFYAGFPRDHVVNLYGSMVDALLQVNEKGGTSSLVCCYLATEAFHSCVSSKKLDIVENENLISEIDFALTLLQKVKPSNMVAAFLQMLRYVGKFITLLTAQNEDDSIQEKPNKTNNASISLVVDEIDLITMSLFGSSLKNGKVLESIPNDSLAITSPGYLNNSQRSLMWLTTNLLSLVKRGIRSPSIQKVIQSNVGLDSNIYLYLWQQLMFVQTESIHHLSDCSEVSKDFWEAIYSASQETLEHLQKILPLPEFLACSTALLKDSEINQNFRKHTLLLLSDRASNITDSAETSLFLETIPDLVELVKPSSSGDISEEDNNDIAASRRNIITQQTALIAIETIAQSFISSGNPLLKNWNRMKSVFVPALQAVHSLINKTSNKIMARENDFNIVDGQLLSNAALCAGTLVSIMKQRCVSLLRKILQPLLDCLSHINDFQKKKIMENIEINDEDDVLMTQKLLQRSILHSLSVILEALPTFLSPFLNIIFSPSYLPSSSLRKNVVIGEADAVETLAEELQISMASKIPMRSFVPSVCGSIIKTLSLQSSDKLFSEVTSLLNTLTVSIRNASRSDLSPMVNVIVGAITTIYDRKVGYDNDQLTLISTANQCVIDLVMKLSEAQLRPLFARLREWRGDLTESEDLSDSAIARRFAFWKMASSLSLELKGIFLPCMSSVFIDVVKELEFAVSKLVDTSKGSKRRRLATGYEENSGELDVLRPLQPVLLCIESALKADAHEGGNWIRADENQRYNMILTPLTKLLQAKIPTQFPVEQAFGEVDANNSISAYQKIVQGDLTTDKGSVVASLTALATAAGNDQLWKPLNYAIMDACGNETRAEVRKAGINCLLSLLQLLGEEYMVLLPECLPVLSELLEESDEEIANLARECIRLGEELLGESLEDSLR